MLSLDPMGENDKYTKNAKQLNDELKRTFGELQLKKYYASFANLDASVKQAKDKLDELAQLGTTTLTATTVQNLADTVSSLVYANYTEQQRDETLLSEQSKIDAEQQKVDEVLNGLETGLDISALDASLESLDSLDRDEYDFSKLEGLKNSVAVKDVSWNNKVIKCSAFKTQDDVDSVAAHIITEITSSKINYKIIATEGITFNVSDIQAVPYGTEVVAAAKDGATAWYIGYKSVTASHDVKYQYSGETFTFVVMGDTTIKTEASSETITSRVQVQNNINNRVTSVIYVADNYKLPEPIAYPFYNFSNYEVNGEKHAIGDTVSVNSDTVVKAVYEPNAQETFTVTYASVMDSVENWEEISTKEYAYNSVVKYTSKVPVYWIGVYTSSEILNGNDYGYVLLGYGTEFIYHVNENIEIDATNKKAYDEQFVNELNPDGYTKNPYFVGNLDVDENGVSANIRYANTNFNDTSQAVIKDQLASKGKISMLGRYYIPQEAEMIECGILFTKGEVSSLTLSDVDGKNVIRCKSFTQTAGNQFVISKVGCKAGETVSAILCFCIIACCFAGCEKRVSLEGTWKASYEEKAFANDFEEEYKDDEIVTEMLKNFENKIIIDMYYVVDEDNNCKITIDTEKFEKDLTAKSEEFLDLMEEAYYRGAEKEGLTRKQFDEYYKEVEKTTLRNALYEEMELDEFIKESVEDLKKENEKNEEKSFFDARGDKIYFDNEDEGKGYETFTLEGDTLTITGTYDMDGKLIDGENVVLVKQPE